MPKHSMKDIPKRFKTELATYRLVLADDRTPRLARWLLAAAVGYALMPFDLIPDFIPLLGMLDDALILPLLVWTALRFVPDDVVDDCRRRAEESAG